MNEPNEGITPFGNEILQINEIQGLPFSSEDHNPNLPIIKIKDHHKRKKVIWTKEEDERIVSFVKRFGKSWTELSKIYPSKTPKQYREHYVNSLQGNYNKNKHFTAEEDAIILNFVNQNGNQFTTLEKLLPGRAGTSIKNRYHFLRNRSKNSPYSPNGINTAPIESQFRPISESTNGDDGSDLHTSENQIYDYLAALL